MVQKEITIWKNYVSWRKTWLKLGHTSSIRRIEGNAFLSCWCWHSYKSLWTRFGSFSPLNGDFIGKKALKKIKAYVKRLQVGLHIKCEKLGGPNTTFWHLKSDNKIIGKVTSAVCSPRLKKNIALAMVDINYSVIGMEIDVSIEDKNFKCEVVEKPFFDPKKQITSKSL